MVTPTQFEALKILMECCWYKYKDKDGVEYYITDDDGFPAQPLEDIGVEAKILDNGRLVGFVATELGRINTLFREASYEKGLKVVFQ